MLKFGDVRVDIPRRTEEVWGPDQISTRGLRVCVKNLRRKLEPEPHRQRHLVTDPGLGYRPRPDGTVE